MNELVITRHNHLIDPTLHIWGWEIPVYLFLGGLVGGMMLISGYFILTGRTKNTLCSCFRIPLIGVIAISIGMLALFLDLEHKLYVWNLYLNFKWQSPMSWGAWILLIIYPILFVTLLIRIPENTAEKFPALGRLSEKIRSNAFLVKLIGSLSMVFGGLLGAYTAILLSGFSARPAWNSPMLWTLFLTSGLSSAAALVHLIGKDPEERHLLAKADNGFLIAELIIIVLMIIGFVSSSQVHIDAAKLILSGPYAASFWIFVVLSGIVIPLIIQLFSVNNKIVHTNVAPILVMLGGLILRFIVVYAGQFSHWPRNVFTGF
ncbi:polysulfide reductase [Bacteroidetes/Chlorobi group bacterium Naka2016]|jgi:formate-dependent nitrite reductase membrane component NrfD|nr:MAG: polysulfide reductase [Bacteroidetes/Chlorobi group bacterium Naka2016]